MIVPTLQRGNAALDAPASSVYGDPPMARTRYVIQEPDNPHFLTCTVVEWLPVFTRPDAVQILLNSGSHQRVNNGFRLFGYVILENHLHFVARAPRLDKCVSSFKSSELPRRAGADRG